MAAKDVQQLRLVSLTCHPFLMIMKNKFTNPLIFALLACLLLAAGGCKYPDEFKEVQQPNQFKMLVSPYFEKNDKLSKDALLQYGSYFRNFYVVVMDAPKSKHASLDDYCRAETQKLLKQIRKTVRNDSIGLKLNGLPAIQLGYTGLVGTDKLNEFVYYKLVFVEANDRYYQVCLWTWAKNRDKHIDAIEKMVNSFEVL